jgi:protein associated with RNAse G/E
MSPPVHIDFRKWPDHRHWQFAMDRLGEDEHGTWLWSAPGAIVRRGDESPKILRRLAVKLITPDSWWTAVWNEGGDFEIYVDIATPPRWDGDRVTMIDLDLDVVRHRDGRTLVLDEDEFDEHRATLGYPPDVVDRARTTTAAVFLDVERRTPPFDATGERWLEAAAGLAARQ